MKTKTIKLIIAIVTLGTMLNARTTTNDFCMHTCLAELDEFNSNIFTRKEWMNGCKKRCSNDNPFLDEEDKKRHELEKELNIKFNTEKDPLEWCGKWKH